MRRNATSNDYVVLARALLSTLVEELSVVSCQLSVVSHESRGFELPKVLAFVAIVSLNSAQVHNTQ